MRGLLHAYRTFRPFSDEEAWLLFRLAAIGEAIGWTLLIIGIACKRLPVWWNYMPVHIAGEIHGSLFLIYAAAGIVLAPSLGWSPLRGLFATACSVPPYGSLVYEQISAWQRHRVSARQLQALTSYQLLNAGSVFGGRANTALSPNR